MRRVDSLEDSDASRDWEQEEKGTTEDEMAGWHHWLNGHETEWTLGVGDGQGGLACCDLWGHKESDATEWLNSTELRSVILIRSLVFNILKGKCVQLKGKDLTYLLYLSKSEIFILLVSDTSDSALSLVKHLWSSYSVLESVLATWIYREDVSGP